MGNDPTQGDERAAYVALDTSSTEGMRDRPPRCEAQGDGAAVVLRERESRLHGEGRQVFAAHGQGGRRDAKRHNCSGASRAKRSADTGTPDTLKGVRPVWGGADGKGAGNRHLAGGLLYACAVSRCSDRPAVAAWPNSSDG